MLNKQLKPGALAAGTIAAVIIVIVFATNRQSRDSAGIIGSSYRITQEDYWRSLKVRDRFDSGSANGYFRDSAANKHTLDLFSFLQDRFRDMEYDDHMQAAGKYLRDTITPRERAEEMYDLYGKYNAYQKEIYLDRNRWADGGTPQEMLDKLQALQDLRRHRFGRDTADSIFGVEVKSGEYALRKQIVIGDAGLSGSEKEERLASLRRRMWGSEADSVENGLSPLDRYNEKLKIHQADLASMDGEERAKKISEFRREIFSPEEAGRMDNADRQLGYLRNRDGEYARQSRVILDDAGLSEQEKSRKIRELHKRLYGTH